MPTKSDAKVPDKICYRILDRAIGIQEKKANPAAPDSTAVQDDQGSTLEEAWNKYLDTLRNQDRR